MADLKLLFSKTVVILYMSNKLLQPIEIQNIIFI